MNLIWTRQALERLEEIQDFIAQRSSPLIATSFISSLIERAETLKEFPSIGRMVPDLSRIELRELIEGNYRIVYRLLDSSIIILTVFEGHKLLSEEEINIMIA
ncbi:MAG: hypothetical protein BGO77_05720 [Caedibacter sp. 37-49]|nr:MAG: hypothetical protein BGO77_05720 [Caedibacter sp. 37-49]